MSSRLTAHAYVCYQYLCDIACHILYGYHVASNTPMLKLGENNQFAGKLQKDLQCNQLNRGLPQGIYGQIVTCWTIDKLLLPFLSVGVLLGQTTGVVVGSGEPMYASEVL